MSSSTRYDEEKRGERNNTLCAVCGALYAVCGVVCDVCGVCRVVCVVWYCVLIQV